MDEIHPMIKKYITLSRDEFFEEFSFEDISENERWFFVNCGQIEHAESRKVKNNLAAELNRKND